MSELGLSAPARGETQAQAQKRTNAQKRGYVKALTGQSELSESAFSQRSLGFEYISENNIFSPAGMEGGNYIVTPGATPAGMEGGKMSLSRKIKMPMVHRVRGSKC